MNPLVLKADLVASGVAVSEDLRPRLRLGDRADTALDLALPAGITASVPVLHDGGGDPGAYRLVPDGDRVRLARPHEPADDPAHIAIDVHPVPRFYARRTARGIPMDRIAERRGRTLVVTPLGRCGYSISGHPCTFCIEGGRPTAAASAIATPADVIEAVGAAVAEGGVDVVLFNTDSAEGEDGGVALLTPYVQAVRRHAHVLLAAQLHPPRSEAWVDRTYALGLDAISYGLEVFDDDAFGRLCVGRARYIGRERYLEMLARAAAVFPRGTVWSELALGVEPVDRTAAGIDALAGMGVVPVLAIPRGPHGLGQRPSPDEVTALIARLTTATTAHHVPVTWVRDLGASITPSDARLLDGPHPGPGGRVGARLAVRGARMLSRLRRRLRVRLAESGAASH